METKWIGRSLTIWGVFVTALAGALPFISQIFGWDVNPAEWLQFGDAGTDTINAVGTMIGLGMTIWGRLRAKTNLIVH